MPTIAIGDIHGNIRALDDLLRQIEDDLSPDHTVVFLGDYIDRGPDTKACLDRIIDFRAGCRASVVTLMGNHEEWLLRTMADYTRHSWLLGMEAFETIASYSKAAALELRRAAEVAGATLITERAELPYEVFFREVPQTHVTFLQALALRHADVNAIYSHGGLDPDVSSVEDQPPAALLWGTDGFPTRYHGERAVVYGHWNNAVLDEHGWPQPHIEGRTFGIDTSKHGVLTAWSLPDRRLIQSGRHGSRRAQQP
jgi:serine/threonine protein phosphatase 1